MKYMTCILVMVLAISCTYETTIKGKFTAKNDSAIFDFVEFDGEAATFGGRVGKLMPAYSYKTKNNMIYIETHEGILKFEIIDNKTIKGMVSIVKGEEYIKQ